MIRRLVAVVSVTGGLVFSVYVATNSPVQRQVDELADAGRVPNRNATCPVRLDEDFALDAGLGLYQRLLFPVSLVVLPDGGRDVQMPPMPIQRVRDSIDVVDWNDCSLAAATAPVQALWGNPKPFTTSGVVKPWCRARLPAQPCLLLDGGTFGDRNITPCSARANPATCERVSSGVIYLGDNEEDL